MAEAAEYLVSIVWRRGNRRAKVGYRVIARSVEDAFAFARFRFQRRHPAEAVIEEMMILPSRP